MIINYSNLICLNIFKHYSKLLEIFYVKEILTKSTLNADIFTGYFRNVKLISTTSLTQVRIAFPDSQITRTLFGVTLSFTPASRKSILALAAALTKFLAEILSLDTRTRIVARSIGMIAG